MTRPKPGFALPTRDGVGASCVNLPQVSLAGSQGGAWPTVLDFLAAHFHRIPRADWAARMTQGDVLDAVGKALAVSQVYLPGTKLYYFRQPPPELPVPFTETVLFQDEHLLVADKPHFLPVVPSGRYLQETLLVRLKRKLGLNDLVPLHRIDRDTAGLVLFSVNPASRGAYAALFRERHIAKQYEAIAPWRADLALPQVYRSRVVESEAFMQMTEIPGTPNAETHIALLATEGARASRLAPHLAFNLARYRLAPLTGYRHQLRVQMAALGIPILNDRIYPVLHPELALGEAPDYSRPLQLLAQSLAFEDPLTGALRTFESQLVLKI